MVTALSGKACGVVVGASWYAIAQYKGEALFGKGFEMQILRPTKREKTLLARHMRRFPTTAERTLWWQLKDNRLGVKFRNQVKKCGYILDFGCQEKRLAIELDGSAHVGREAYDESRDARLWRDGWRTLRFKNEDVFERMPWVVSRICEWVGVADVGVRASANKDRRRIAARISGGDIASQRRRWSQLGERIKKSQPFDPTPRLRKVEDGES